MRLILTLMLALPMLVVAQTPPEPSRSFAVETQHYLISIDVVCREGEIACDDVVYHGKSKRTGAEITLKGTAIFHLCADGVTPCHFLGYEFKNGTVTYTVTGDNELIVRDGDEVLIDEPNLVAVNAPLASPAQH